MNNAAEPGVSPKIVSLSCTYPNRVEPQLGIFVQRRLQALAEMAEIQVVSPVALLKYGNSKGQRVRMGNNWRCPKADARIPVLYPRWIYAPAGGFLTALLLFLQVLRPIVRMRRYFRFELIDTHFGYPDGITGALLSSAFRVPFTITLRGSEPKHSRTRVGRWWMSWAFRKASRIFAVSGRLGQFAIALGAEPHKVKISPNGVDTTVFFQRNRIACREKYDLASDVSIILSAGALVERKGHHRVIKALSGLLADGRRVVLLIAGGTGPEGDFEARIRTTMTDLGVAEHVRFLGHLSSEAMAEVMCAADVLCLASSNEGWPNVVHEALACGTPVVATDVGAIPDLLPDDRYGLKVPVEDDAALYSALRLAIDRPWDRTAISARGMERTWEKVALEVLEEIEDVIARKEGK